MPNSRKLQRRKNFDQVVHWVSDEFEQSDKVCMTPFKEKYVEVYGSPAKNWEKVSRHVRGRLNLEAKSIMETYVGKRKNFASVKYGFGWEKHEVEMIFVFFWKSTTYDCLLLLIVFDYFVKNVAYRKSSILIVSSDFVKGVAHEKSSILTVFSYFEKGLAHVWKIIHFDCF